MYEKDIPSPTQERTSAKKNSIEEMADVWRAHQDGAIESEVHTSITSVQELSDAIIGGIDDLVARSGALSGVDAIGVSQSLERTMRTIADRDGAEQLTTYYKAFIENVIAHIRGWQFAARSKEEQQKFIMTFEQAFLSYTPNILDHVGGVEDSIDILSQMRVVPQLKRFYEEKLSGLAYDYGASFSPEERKNVVKRMARLIENAPVARQFQLVRVYRDIVAHGIGGGSIDDVAGVVVESLQNVRDTSALLDMLIDDVRQDIMFMREEDSVPRRELASDNFWHNKSVDARVTLPENCANFRAIAMAQNAVGLRNIYGDITNVVTGDALGQRLRGEGDVSDDEKALLHVYEIVENFYRHPRGGAVPRHIQHRIEQIVRHMHDHRSARAVRSNLPGGDSDALRHSVLREIAARAQERGAVGAMDIGESDIQELHFFNADDAVLFSEMHEPLMRDRIEAIINVPLTDLDQRTQRQLLEFLAGRKREQLAAVSALSARYTDEEQRKNFLRAFLSLEHGGQEMGAKILAIGERYADDGVAQRIFAKYTELVDAANSVEDYLREQFGAADDVAVQEIAENLLVRGKDILKRFATKKDITDKQVVLKQLDTVRADIVLFNTFILALKKTTPHFNIADASALSVGSRSGSDVAQDTVLLKQIQRIYSETLPERAPIAFEKFAALLNESDVFFVRRNDGNNSAGELLTFMMAVRKEDGSINLRSLNIDKKYGAISPGVALLDKVMQDYKERAERVVIEAKPKHAVSYMRKYGFVIDGTYDAGGKSFFTLTMDGARDVKEGYVPYKTINVDCTDTYCNNAIDTLRAEGLGDNIIVTNARYTHTTMTFALAKRHVRETAQHRAAA